jgi:hypothetical protein
VGKPFGGSGSGGAFGSAGSSSPKHHGLLHDIVHGPAEFTGHLLGDVRDMAVGLPEGFAMLATHPVTSIEEIGKTTWHDWSPLFHGDVGKFGRQFMAHPLAPILDVAGLVTGGAGLAARGGKALGEVGLISREARLAKLGEGVSEEVKIPGAPAQYRHFDKNPVVRLRQRATVNLGHKLAEAAPDWFGRTAEVKPEFADRNVRLGADGKVSPQDVHKIAQVQKGRIADLTDAGFVERKMRKQESYRAGATRAMIGAQLAAFVKAGEDISKRPAEVANMIERHGRQQLLDHAYRVSHTDAKQLTPGLRFVSARPADVRAVHSFEDFRTEMENFGNRHTTLDMGKATRDANGDYLVVHKRAAVAYGKEGANSATFLHKLIRYPTQTWKYLILATRPAYFVNNAVGNTFMAMATLGPVGFARGLVDAYRQVHGEAATAKSLEGADKSLHELHGDWQDKWYLGVHQGFGQEAMRQLSVNRKIREAGHEKTARVVQVAEQGLYPITHKVADVFLRRVMINSLMREHPMVQRLMQGVEDRAVSPHVLDASSAEDMHRVVPGDGQHIYHATSVDNLKEIAQHGLRPGKERRGEVTGVYFADDGVGITSLVPRSRRGNDVVLRVKKGVARVQKTDMFEEGSGFSEWVSPHGVSARRIEYLGADGHWHAVADAAREPRVRKMSFNDAASYVSRDPAVRDRVQEMVNNALGDYHHLNGLEQTVRQFVPFYTWDRAIARHGIHLALDRTGRAAAGAEVGELGTHTTEEKLGGDIPSFMKGLVVLPGHGKDGRANVLSTQGLNPYASLPDVADTAGALVGVGSQGAGETLASQLNPFITGLIESTTGQSLLSGAKLPHRSGGIVGQTVADVAENLPHVKLIETLLSGEAQPKPNARTGKVTNFLYRKNARAQIAALLGVPVKELDTARAAEMARKARGEKKGRHRSGAFGS